MRVAKSVLLLLGASSLFLASPAHASWLREPWVNDLGKDHASIYWEGDPFGSGAQTMQWGPGSSLNQSATGVKVSGSVYKVDLTGLSPSSSYSFKVTSNSDVSAVGSFGTAPTDGSSEPFRFGVYGDNRTNATDHASVVAGLKNMSPDFVLNTGDLADTITTFNYLEFFSIEKDLLYHTGIFPAPGNHDITAIYQSGFNRPNWYSFRWGNAFFLSISASGADSYTSGTQYTWIQQQLQTAHSDPTIEWLFVYHHFPVYSSDTTHGSTTDMQTSLNPLYEQYGVDAVFNGHSHTYERDEKDGIEYYVVGGGGAPLYSLGTAVAGQQYAESTLSFLVADVNGGSLDLKAYKPDGTMIDSKHIDKGTPPSPTPTGTGNPTPSPSGTPGGNGNGASGGGCDIATLGAGASPALLVLGAFAIALGRRRRRR